MSKNIGLDGENKVKKVLVPKFFDNQVHKTINNLVLIDKIDGTHQIDHIEIRKNGIFCIETKNYKGEISGTSEQPKWVQSLSNGKKYYFLNPLKQNKTHIKYIQRVLKKKYKVNSLVVFVQNNSDNIKIKNVINLDDLKKYLREYNDGTELSVTEIEDIYTLLTRANGKVTDEEHIDNVKTRQQKIKNNICPFCNVKLVYENEMFGPLYRCSNYPKCSFYKR